MATQRQEEAKEILKQVAKALTELSTQGSFHFSTETCGEKYMLVATHVTHILHDIGITSGDAKFADGTVAKVLA